MKIFILDRETLFRDGLRSLLLSANHDVACYEADQDLLPQLLAAKPEVVLIEPAIFTGRALNILEEIKNSLPFTKVAFMATECNQDEVTAAIQGGVDGYFTKHIESDEFFAMMAHLAAGEPAISTRVAQQLFKYFQTTPGVETKKTLTDKEGNVLYLASQGFSNKEIAEQLQVSTNTIKFHLKEINRKLGTSNRTEAVISAIQNKHLAPPE